MCVCVNSGRENVKYIALNFRNFCCDFVGDTSGRRVPNTVAPTDGTGYISDNPRRLKRDLFVNCDVHKVKHYIEYVENGGTKATRINGKN